MIRNCMRYVVHRAIREQATGEMVHAIAVDTFRCKRFRVEV